MNMVIEMIHFPWEDLGKHPRGKTWILKPEEVLDGQKKWEEAFPGRNRVCREILRR